jgi:SAM-dependent methyltransferase
MSFLERIRSFVPKPLRELMARLLGIRRLQDRVAALESRVDNLDRILDSSGVPFELSRERWRHAHPREGLTWGQQLTGDAFVEKLNSYEVFGPSKRVLEIGPGYGRLVKSIVGRNLTFESYLGVDLSATNVEHLRKTYGTDNIKFVEADVEQVDLSDKRFDVIYSSLTLKHLYPTFENALKNVCRAANPGCMICFDLIEGTGGGFDADGVTYVRRYTQNEVREILNRVSLERVAFDTVVHDVEHARLLVVARKPSERASE